MCSFDYRLSSGKLFAIYMFFLLPSASHSDYYSGSSSGVCCQIMLKKKCLREQWHSSVNMDGEYGCKTVAKIPKLE